MQNLFKVSAKRFRLNQGISSRSTRTKKIFAVERSKGQSNIANNVEYPFPPPLFFSFSIVVLRQYDKMYNL